MRLLISLFLFFLLFLQHGFPWHAVSTVAIGAVKQPKTPPIVDSTASPEYKGPAQTDKLEDQNENTTTKKEVATSQSQQKGASYLPGLGFFLDHLPFRGAEWLLVLADLLLISLLAQLLYTQRLSNRYFGALDKEVDSVKQMLQQILFSTKTLGAQIKALPPNSQELRRDDLENVRSSVAKLATELERLPARIKGEVVHELELRERTQKEDQERRLKQRLQADFENGLNELPVKFPILEISSVTNHLLSSLQSQAKDLGSLETNYAEYLNLAKQWEVLKAVAAKLKDNPGGINEDLSKKLEGLLKEIRDSSEALTKNHRNIWFTVLLDKADRFPSIKELAARLMDLLGLEEIPVQVGGEIKDRANIDMASVDGGGDRNFVKEILEKGYLEKKSGQVVKKPKVTVQLR